MVPMSYNVGKQSGALFIGGRRNRGGPLPVPLCIEPVGLSSLPTVRPRALFRLLQATLVALVLLTVGSHARAAVPMCSEDGRSVAAPPIMRPGQVRVLESQGDCERLRALLSRTNQGHR